MFLIAVDDSGRLVVKRGPKRNSNNHQSTICLPTVADSSSNDEILLFLTKIGLSGTAVIQNFELNLSASNSAPRKYAIYSLANLVSPQSGYEVKSLDEIWQEDIDDSIAVALNKIVAQIDRSSPGSVVKLESKFLQHFDLNKKSNRVYFAKSEAVVASEALISYLSAFAVANGEKTARLCMHQDQGQVIQEMLMIHAEPTIVGPLRQNRDSSVSYHLVRGALEITLHHGGTIGDKIYQIERDNNQPSSSSSLRVPAKIFRTIRTLTDSAVFVEVQSGPFTDSESEWSASSENEFSTQRILIVGSTGEIGHPLSQFLEGRGMEVFRASRSVDLNQKNCLKIDLLNIPEVIERLESPSKFDAAVLSVGHSRLREAGINSEESELINFRSQVSFGEYFVASGCKKLVFLSSNRVFRGKSANVIKHAKYSYTTEYGRQKAMAETELLKLGEAVRVIRITKVLSESNSLLTDWVLKLKSGQKIMAFTDVMVSPVTLDDTVKVIAEVIESECESIMQFSATDEIRYFDLAQFVARYLGVDARLVVAQNAEESGETPLEHASLECSEFRSVAPSSSLIAVQKVLEKMVSS